MPYDIVQSTFLMCMAADAASGIAATQAELQAYLAAALNGGTDPIGTRFDGFFPLTNAQLAGGDWSVVWGPCAFSLKPNGAAYAANAMYVAHSPSLSTYVVAVAGTNPQSLYDWIREDGDVAASYMARWPFAVPFVRSFHLPWVIDPPPGVSAATALGISNLLTAMADPQKGSLQNFLTHAADANSTLVFTGHSLAGALAPTLALYLYPQPQASAWHQVLVLAMAGPSPGNKPFAALFTAGSAFAPVSSGVVAPYGNWNTDYCNEHDIVPHAWHELGAVISGPNASGNYPSIYGVLDLVLGKATADAATAAKVLALGGDYHALTQGWFTPDWGCWNWVQNPDGSWQYPPAWTPLTAYTDAHPMTSIDDLGEAVLAAHVDQYYNFFGVVPAPRMPISLPDGGLQADLRKALHAMEKISV
jgi:Lipase (class 3)